MDNFKIIYRILKAMDASIDGGQVSLPTHTDLGITLNRYYALLIAIIEEELIAGVQYNYWINSEEPCITIVHPRITLKGFEYLANNSTLQKAKNIIAGAIDTGTKFIP